MGLAVTPPPDATLPTPERFVGDAAHLPPQLPLAASGVQRWVWQGRYGPMLIEVVGEQVRVNGQPVQPHRP